MHDALLVRGSKPSAIWRATVTASSRGIGAFGDAVGERRTFDEFQDERENAFHVLEPMDVAMFG